MKTINANLSRLPQVYVLGFPALYTPHKVSRRTVHFGLYQYEMQGNLDDPERPIIITDVVNEDFCGTLLSISPLLLQGVERLIIDRDDIIILEDADQFTPAEFDQEYYKD